MTTRLTATSLLSRSLLRRVTSGTRYPLGLEPSPRIPQSPSRTASSTSSGDPTGPEPPAPAMDSPIKVVSTIGGGRGSGAGGGGVGAIDAGRSARKPLSLWPGMYHSPVTNALWEARSSIFERMMDAGNGGGDQNQRPQTELLTKTPAQSRTSIVYKFATDDILREQYRDPWNEVRIGKLLEDLDALAGTIAVKVLSYAPSDLHFFMQVVCQYSVRLRNIPGPPNHAVSKQYLVMFSMLWSCCPNPINRGMNF